MSDAISSRPKRYFGFHYLIMRFVGMGWWHHPDEGDTKNFPGWYLYYSIVTQFLWVVAFVSLETIDPFVGEKDTERFMFSISFVVTHNLTIIKLSIFFLRNKEIQEIVRTIEIGLRAYYQNEVKNRTTVRITKIASFIFIFFGWMTVINSYTYGAIQDIRWKSYVKSLNGSTPRPPRSLGQPIFIPWGYERDVSYIPTFILEMVGLLWNGHILLVIDTFIGSVIMHLSSQFSIVREAIETAYDRTMTQLSENAHRSDHFDESFISEDENLLMVAEENNERIVRASFTEDQIESALQTTLVNCFTQHQILIDCVQKFNTIYSYGFMTQLLSSLAAICAVMVQISQDASSLVSIRMVTSVVFFSAMITQLAIQCFTGNELTLQAALVSDAVMQSKWERMTPRLRSLLLMMMMRAQRPLRLSAAGFAYMDSDCFVAIIKAAYSYYAVLSQTQV